MLTDSDLTEQALISRDRLNQALRDVIGSGTPRHNALLQITEIANKQVPGLFWGKNGGLAYIDGIPAQVRAAPDAPDADVFSYEHQLDYPLGEDGPVLPDSAYRLYLDVWERSVSWLEDEVLRDPGLQGADTTSRTQTMAQIKWCAVDTDPLCSKSNPAIGTARLKLLVRNTVSSVDPCDPCADELQLNDSVGNYLFRAEVHDVHYDETAQPDSIVLKWSSENGAEAYKTADVPAGFASNQYIYEFFDELSEKRLGVNLAYDNSNIRVIDGRRSALENSFSAQSAQAKTYVRRWDGWCMLEKADSGDWQLTSGMESGIDLTIATAADNPGHVINGAKLQIELRALTLIFDPADYAVIAGDYWAAAVREIIHQKDSVLLDNDTPHGEMHHYMLLLDVAADGERSLAFSEECDDYNACKLPQFPSLTDLQADDICFDNSNCAMPQVKTVQNALDHLCQENDLPWHNKHLHGWGIVCGLMLQCDFNDPQSVILEPGYALDCQGRDMVIKDDKPLTINIPELLEKADIDSQSLDKDQGLCLYLEYNDKQLPGVALELLQEEKSGLLDRLQGTLLLDFYQDCILDLVNRIKEEFNSADIKARCAETKCGKVLIKPVKRRILTLANLLFHKKSGEQETILNISPCEHALLHDTYNNFKDHLRSKTFCTQFSDHAFPEYPFEEKKACRATWFSPELLDHFQLHPNGKTLFAWQRNSSRIFVFQDSGEGCSGDLVTSIDIPQLEKGSITDLIIDKDNIIHLSAIVHKTNTLLLQAKLDIDNISECQLKLNWLSNLFNDVKIVKLEHSPWSDKQLYAVALTKGIYLLDIEALSGAKEFKQEPAWGFPASGHIAFDNKSNRVFATAFAANIKRREAKKDFNYKAYINNSDASSEKGDYNSMVIFDGLKAADKKIHTLRLMVNDSPVGGHDGFIAAPFSQDAFSELTADFHLADRSAASLFVVINETEKSDIKTLCRFNSHSLEKLQEEKNNDWHGTKYHLFGEAGHISLHYIKSEKSKGIIASRYAMHDIQYIPDDSEHREKLSADSIPVQAGPVMISADDNAQQIFVLNHMGQSITVLNYNLPGYRDDRLLLSNYRNDAFSAFFALFAGLLQYLKDCFCQHLLVECPDECTTDDKVYLGCVSIEDEQINNICNFTKRKYVKSFPTIGYWLSLIPVAPMVSWLIEELCCLILPDFVKKQEQQSMALSPQIIGMGKAMINADQENIIAELSTQGKTLAKDTISSLIGAGYKDKSDYQELILTEYRYKPGVFIARQSKNTVNDKLIQKVQEIDFDSAQGQKKITQMEDKVIILTEQKKAAEARIEKIETDKAAADQQVTALEEEISQLKQKTAKVTALETQVGGLLAEKTQVAARFTELEKGFADLQLMSKEVKPIVEGNKSVATIDGISENNIKLLKRNNITTVKSLAEADVATLEAIGIKKEVATGIVGKANTRVTIKA